MLGYLLKVWQLAAALRGARFCGGVPGDLTSSPENSHALKVQLVLRTKQV